MKKENSLIRSQSEQRAREVCHLEEELGKVKVCLSQSQNFAEEMRGKFSNVSVLYIFFLHLLILWQCFLTVACHSYVLSVFSAYRPLFTQ